jgi:hypothetical protein
VARPAFVCAWFALFVILTGCDQVRATTDRALVTMSMKSACPDPTEGRAAGAESADLAVACFRKATDEGSAALLLRVTCRNRSAASCKQTDATTREAERAMADLKKLTWPSPLGKWNDDKDGKIIVFAVDTAPGEKKVSTVTTCRIVEGDRWAVCEVGEMTRDAAEQKMK